MIWDVWSLGPGDALISDDDDDDDDEDQKWVIMNAAA